MNLGKFLFVIIVVTAVALAYVHQKVELLRINYSINQNMDNLLVLLDQNSSLMYNVDNMQEPLYLEQRLLAEEVNWEIPSRWDVVGLAEAAR